MISRFTVSMSYIYMLYSYLMSQDTLNDSFSFSCNLHDKIFSPQAWSSVYWTFFVGICWLVEKIYTSLKTIWQANTVGCVVKRKDCSCVVHICYCLLFSIHLHQPICLLVCNFYIVLFSCITNTYLKFWLIYI